VYLTVGVLRIKAGRITMKKARIAQSKVRRILMDVGVAKLVSCLGGGVAVVIMES